MTKNEQVMLDTLIEFRLDSVRARLRSDSGYQALCLQQEQSAEAAQRILHKLETEEQRTVRRHYEGEEEKVPRQLREAYLQGMQDCVRLFAFLGLFAPISTR